MPYGSSLIHGVDGAAVRVEEARKKSVEYSGVDFQYFAEDFGDLPNFIKRNENWILNTYDIILLLGVYHQCTRPEKIKPIVDMAGKYLLCRGALYETADRGFLGWIATEGFDLVYSKEGPPETGKLWIFKRK